MASGETVRVGIDHGIWGLVLVLAFFLVRSFVRARPGRELGRVIAVEIRWRYLKWKDVPDAELQRLLRDGWSDDDPTSGPP